MPIFKKLFQKGGDIMKKLSFRALVIMGFALIASLATATAVAAGPFPTAP
jgi:hypothetical protein